MKNHLKRIASPHTWVIDRKSSVFITRPKPGAHKMGSGLPLGVILRDFLGLSTTMNESKKVLNNNDILVDGKRRKDYRYIVGLFDVITIPIQKKSFRLMFNKKKQIVINEISDTESLIKPCKVVGKTILTKGKIQLNLHDGKNIISDTKVKVGDTLLLSLPKLEVKEVLPLEKESTVYLIDGKHCGDVGLFKEIRKEEAIYTKDKKDIETAKEYLFVVGKKKSMIEIKN
ncbi:30S ribosomal protein S4e [Candidatus Woesearchaeota archaeon]|jgi:small subunit ribosomal protein S4e|nr:30S ribosomal protein S4e [Candidatus Woesearchaeota archaeon]MBT4110357.1 30S ribosomal protein S4e [Candidatus Woesearchaeota archaeon]MBT4336119.1 30S ribosomal protein S4e [Candidatus Woesearchaeota archaeon]MBT4468902.1 30S ribosomal protein S4e [Candidatus Woesearchaeota archaeon]MBT6744779.1 30S ribosomal protein S4e [Candidatus Woesearchaeota archaeon]